MKKHIFYACLYFSMVVSATNIDDSQEIQGIKNIHPIEPTSSSLGRYGEFQMDYSNGQPDISIPIYEIKCGDLTLPITLRYQGGGIKVQQDATWVGLGWDLFYGGQITRVVNGYPDEQEPEPNNRPQESAIRDYLDQHKSDIFDSYISLLADGRNAAYSYMPDEYYYNIGAESGKFIGKNVEIQIPYKGIQIHGVNKIINSIGETFYFSTGETTDINVQYFPNYISSWYIDKIISPRNYEIKYEYQADGTYTKKQISCSEGYSNVYVEGLPPAGGTGELGIKQIPLKENIRIEKVTNIKKPKYIYFDGGRLTFLLSSRNDISNSEGTTPIQKLDRIIIERLSENNIYEIVKGYLFNYSYNNNRLFLDNIVTFSNTMDYQLLVSFQYDPTPLPEKNSFSYDYCGYYNGSNNTTPIPLYQEYVCSTYSGDKIVSIGGANKNNVESTTKAGSLVSIEYPTKGKTVFTWENHRYGGEQPLYPNQYTSTEYISAYSDTQISCAETPTPQDDGEASSGTKVITNYMDQSVRITGSITRNNLNDFQHNKYDRAKILFIDNTTNETLINRSLSVTTPVTIDEIVLLRAGHMYTLLTYSNCYNTRASASFTYNKYDPETDKYNYIYGGLRIKEITNYDNNGAFIEKKLFTYTDPLNPFKSSGFITNTGDVLLRQVFTHKEKIEYFNGTVLPLCYDLINRSLVCYDTPTKGIYPNNISYQYVQVQNVGLDNKNNGITRYEFRKSLDSYTFDQLITNADQRGQILREEIYDDENRLLKKTIQFYSNHPEVNYNSKGFRMRRAFTTGDKILCNHWENDISIMYVPYNYEYQSRWLKKDSMVVYDFFNNDSVKNKTIFMYSDLKSCEPTKITYSSSDSKNRIINITYPTQVSKNIPFAVKEEYRDNNFLYKQIIKHTSTLYPTITTLLDSVLIQYAKEENPSTEISVKYNNQNNIVEWESHGKKTVNLWSYKNQHIVAEIKNATYQEIEILLGGETYMNEFSSSITLSEQNLSKINNLRMQLPNAQVTTYTYKPLVGMTSQTDPRGVTTYYEYDTFNRLKRTYIKENGVEKTIQTYDYHYKQ